MKPPLQLSTRLLAVTLALDGAPIPLLAAPDDDNLHPGYSMETVLDGAMAPEITGMAFLPDGRMAFSHWGGDRNRVSSAGKVVLFTPAPGDPLPGASRRWTARNLATGLMDPAGLAFLGSALYAGETDRISKITLEGVRSTVVPVVTSGNNHEYNYSVVARGDRLVATLGQAFPPQPSRDRGLVIEVDPATGRAEFLAGGLREPNGLAMGPEGELFATDNQGHWVPTSKLVHIAKGRDFGYDNPLAPFGDLAPTPPALWLPHGEMFNSPGQPAYLERGIFAGQVLLGEVCGGAIRRACLEKVKGVWQGAVMRFIRKGITTGPLRMEQVADGSIWYGGLRGIPGFNCDYVPGGAKNGLHRLLPNGKTAFEVLAIKSREGGFDIAFTKPVDAALADKASYEVDIFRYQATADYGGPKLDGAKLAVSAVRASVDRRAATLDIPGLKEGFVVHFRFRNLRSDSGQALWQEEAWYTLNRLGRAEPPVAVRGATDFDGGALRSVSGASFRVVPGGLESSLAGSHRLLVADLGGRVLLEIALAGPSRVALPGLVGEMGILAVTVTSGGRSGSFRLPRL